jgi:glutamyl-tRNA reductase
LNQQKLIIDLSIPYNVEVAAQQLPQITLINVDELSKIKDSTLQQREAEVPKAMRIIEEHINEFMSWHEMRKNVPVLKAVKNKLEQMNQTYFTIATSSSEINVEIDHSNEDKIQKVINGMAVKMRSDNQKGCYYIEAINEYIAIGTN